MYPSPGGYLTLLFWAGGGWLLNRTRWTGLTVELEAGGVLKRRGWGGYTVPGSSPSPQKNPTKLAGKTNTNSGRSQVYIYTRSRWWVLKIFFLIFTPNLGGNDPI